MVLSVLTIWSARSSTTNLNSRETQKASDEPVEVTVKSATADTENDAAAQNNAKVEGGLAPIDGQESSAAADTSASTSEQAGATSASEVKPKDSIPKTSARFSFRAVRFFYGSRNEVTREQDAVERKKAKAAAQRESVTMLSRSSEKRVQKDALAVQRLIIGSDAIAPAQSKARPAPVSNAQLTRIKSDLTKPKSANKLIKKLRELPVPEEPSETVEAKASTTASPSKRGTAPPIHAVCLECTESDVQTKHFAKLKEQSMISAGVDALSSLFSELHIVDLLAAPDLGLGQPGDGEGLLAGAIPTAETVLEGAAKLTPQLMALGFATGKAIFPDHSTIYPPTDRMSVLTYWWGLELCLPPPTLVHLSQAPNIAHQVINFLSALSLMYNGVREVLPFVRYIGQFVDFEWTQIERQNQGKGVVCAATWIMPAAMVPRPWDFPDPPSALPSPPLHHGTPGISVPDALPSPITGLDAPLPSLVVTPPSVIRDSSPQETS